MARRYGVEMPIIEQMYQVLFEGKGLRQVVVELMLRGPKHELEGARHLTFIHFVL